MFKHKRTSQAACGPAGAPAADATGAPATSTAVGSREKHCCEALRVTEEFLRTIDVDSM